MKQQRSHITCLALLLMLSAGPSRANDAPPGPSTPGGVAFIRGEVNGDGFIDIADSVTLLLYIFVCEPVDAPLDALDLNDDGGINLADPIYELNYLFRRGPAPTLPHPEAGFDPTPNDPYTQGDEFLLTELRVEDLYLEADNSLTVVVENSGPGDVPAGVGLVRVFVDGQLGFEHRFAAVMPPGSYPLATGLRLAGTLRRIAAIVDPDDDVPEPNEFQNSRHYTVTPATVVGPDLIIGELTAVYDEAMELWSLRIAVENIGDASSRDAISLAFEVSVLGDDDPAVEVVASLPTLAPGESAVVVPSPEVFVAEDSRVRAVLDASEASDDLDNTNNLHEAVVPDGPDLTPYEALLAEPIIWRNILWQFSDDVRDYGGWTAQERDDLFEEIRVLERLDPGDRRTLEYSRSLGSTYFFSAEQAWRIFLRHVAQSLWVEVNQRVSWSLTDFSDSELAFLLDGRWLLVYNPTNDEYFFSDHVTGRVTAWNPRILYPFLTNLGFVKSTQKATIHALSDWMRGYLVHILASDDHETLYGYGGPPPPDRVLYSLRQVHKTAGCWGTTGLYGAVLRSINIPARHRQIRLDVCAGREGSHSRPEFVAAGLSMPHGDDLYSSILKPQGAVVPSSSLLYTLEEFNERFIAPELDCSEDGTTCNSIAQQAFVNSTRDHLRLAYENRAHHLLYQYAVFGADKVDDLLRGVQVGGDTVECAQPLFPEAERAQMLADIEARIREIGDGDFTTGRNIVVGQQNAWNTNVFP